MELIKRWSVRHRWYNVTASGISVARKGI